MTRRTVRLDSVEIEHVQFLDTVIKERKEKLEEVRKYLREAEDAHSSFMRLTVRSKGFVLDDPNNPVNYDSSNFTLTGILIPEQVGQDGLKEDVEDPLEGD